MAVCPTHVPHPGVNTQVILSEVIARATAQLVDFVNQPNSLDGMHLAFGDSWQTQEAIALVQNLARQPYQKTPIRSLTFGVDLISCSSWKLIYQSPARLLSVTFLTVTEGKIS